jgi:protocatechuate 3,4-dioxygenase beta subunit
MRLLMCFILALPVFGQEQKLVSLSGTVVNSATGEPVKRALVQLDNEARFGVNDSFAESSSKPFKPIERTAFTDATGAFRFDAVPEGKYACTVQKPEFAYEQAKPVTAPSDNVRLTLAPLGVITGRIVDQDGLPLRAVNVYALSIHIQDGMKHITTDGDVTTDDRGMYRLWNLSPGKYYIKASGFLASTVTYIGDTSPATAGESFPTTYSGGASTRDSATPVEVKPGNEATADLTLNIQNGYSIRGTLGNIAPQTPVKFELVTGGDASPVRVTLNRETGRFEVAAVSPGSYTLRATQGRSIAELPITMPESDVSGVKMTLEAPVDVPVNVRFTNAPVTVKFEGQDMPMRGSCTPILWSADGGMTYVSNAKVTPDRYHVALGCFASYVVSATYGSQDLLTNPDVTVSPGSAPSIEILATHGGGTLTYKVEGDGGKPATVLLFPRSRNRPSLTRRLTSIVPAPRLRAILI